jgi:hypothetical protein
LSQEELRHVLLLFFSGFGAVCALVFFSHRQNAGHVTRRKKTYSGTSKIFELASFEQLESGVTAAASLESIPETVSENSNLSEMTDLNQAEVEAKKIE